MIPPRRIKLGRIKPELAGILIEIEKMDELLAAHVNSLRSDLILEVQENREMLAKMAIQKGVHPLMMSRSAHDHPRLS